MLQQKIEIMIWDIEMLRQDAEYVAGTLQKENDEIQFELKNVQKALQQQSYMQNVGANECKQKLKQKTLELKVEMEKWGQKEQAMVKEFQESESALKKATTTILVKDGEIGRLQLKLHDVRSDIEYKEKVCGRLAQQVVELTQKMKSADNRLSVGNNTKKRLPQEIEDRNRMMKKLRERDQKIGRLQTELNQLRIDIDNKERECQELEQQHPQN